MKMPALLTLVLLFAAVAAWPQAKSSGKDELYQYEGTYEFADGRRITLGIFDEFKQSLVYLDLRTLRQGALENIAAGRFKENNDPTLIFEFSKDGSGTITRLMITKGNEKAQRAERVMRHKRRAVEFRSGDRKLRGDLYLPDKDGRHPIMVFAHGSGPSTRSVAFFTTYFLQLGIGVLTFDKQGAGESEGDWETASFDDLADDIVAGVNFLKTLPQIDVRKIGIFGNSQGGWVGTMAAAKSADVSYLLMRVGSGQDVLETVAHEYKGRFLADGMSENDASEAVAMFREHWKVAKQPGTWEDGNDVILKYRDKPWFLKIYSEPRKKSASSLKWWTWLGKNLSYDSVTYLKELRIPVLWLMAEKDWNVNSQASYPRIINALEANRDQTVMILPGMAHSGLTAKSGYYNEAFSWQYAPGFWETMTDWLGKRRIATNK